MSAEASAEMMERRIYFVLNEAAEGALAAWPAQCDERRRCRLFSRLRAGPLVPAEHSLILLGLLSAAAEHLEVRVLEKRRGGGAGVVVRPVDPQSRLVREHRRAAAERLDDLNGRVVVERYRSGEHQRESGG